MRHLFLLTLLLFSTHLFAQNSPAGQHKWLLRVGALWAIADGELSLDRGGRKVVRTDVEGGAGFHLGLQYKIRPKTGIELGLVKSRMDYFDKEVFATGEMLESSDELDFLLISTAVNFQFLKHKLFRPYFSVMLSYASYGKQMQITTELPSPNLGPSPMPMLVAFELHKGASIGLGPGLDIHITQGWLVGFRSHVHLSNLEASIINDPEDDGRDIDLSVNPLILSLTVGKSF